MLEKQKGGKIRKNLSKAEDVWATKRCRICEILLGDSLDEIPDTLSHPEWHIDTGNKLCALCLAELMVSNSGMSPLDIENMDVDAIVTAVLVRCIKKTSDGNHHNTPNK